MFIKKIMIPLIGLGTWELKGKECLEVVSEALDLGYRHIDTALSYDNHLYIARALPLVPRDEIFLSTKMHLEDIDFDNVEASVFTLCHKCLNELKVDYLDLLMIHAPDHELPIEKVIFAMEKLRDQGKIRYIGVSNFTIHHMMDLLRHEAYFAFNQVEFHPYLNQKLLLEFCELNHIQLVAYRPLGKSKILVDPVIEFLANKYQKSQAQIVLRWLLEKNIPAIPKASRKEHLKANLDIFNFCLTKEDRLLLDALNRNTRYCMSDFAEFGY